MTAPKFFAFYLPQYHPIPENDAWWGKGFTEWTNVSKAKPLFEGHHQPHLPADLGFYDLRLPETRVQQADLAQQYGIDAFCYYHYWFTGKQVLDRPFKEVLASGQPDFPFCLCWANENWTRAWDGRSGDVLLEQHYSEADDLAHFAALKDAFADRRYVRVDGKPLFLVYRTELLPDPAETARRWRQAAVDAGFNGLFLVRVESFIADIDPRSIGFDASVEFAPDWRKIVPLRPGLKSRIEARLTGKRAVQWDIRSIEYATLVREMLSKPEPEYVRYRGACPSFDNSARRSHNPTILLNANPTEYGQWLQSLVRQLSAKPENERIIFINAWNEWGEGNHLEPDQKWGRAYLEATAAAKEAQHG